MSGAYVSQPVTLNLDTGCDFLGVYTVTGGSGAVVGLSGATAELAIKLAPQDTTPIVVITTTPGPSGGLTLGVAPPSPSGSACVSNVSLEALGGPATVQEGVFGLAENTVSLVTLAPLPTSALVLGSVVLVTSTGQFFMWSPGDTSTPNGTTIVASTATYPSVAGNWLLYGTVTITLTNAATTSLLGTNEAYFDLVVTWSNSTMRKLFAGTVQIAQTVA